MKQLFTCLFLCFLCYQGFCGPVFNKLAEVNKCWTLQKDIDKQAIEHYKAGTEKEWIGLHLTLVEKTLRARETSKLSSAQKANRLQALNHLHQYMLAGNFPVNDVYTYRTPIFIDKYDNFCAVGYLVKASGHEDVSRMISQRTNLAYVMQMNYPELDDWAVTHGFTKEELAWIQPAYGPERHARPVGGGTDGTVNELHADNTAGKLYVGGSFTKVDKTINAANIAYLTESGEQFTWHSMGAGVNGPVHAIQEFNGEVFIAGSFSMSGTTALNNTARWDGTAWQPAGCTYGQVNDLIVFNNNLFAVGDFDVCAALAEVNFAKWDGTYWQQFPGLDGHINTVAVMDTVLVLGGSFNYLGTPTNIIKWNENIGFQLFSNSIPNEVMDIQKFKDTMYVACKHSSSSDTNLVLRLNNNTWAPLADAYYYSDGSMSVNTLCAYNDTLSVGGSFAFSSGTFMKTWPNSGGNCGVLYPPTTLMYTPWVSVDSLVNKMVVFNNKLIIGGSFKYSFDFIKTELNSITYQSATPTSVNTLSGSNDIQLDIYPNPVGSNTMLTIENNFQANRFLLRDISGKIILSQPLDTKKQSIVLPAVNSGIYLGEVTNTKGQKIIKKLTVD